MKEMEERNIEIKKERHGFVTFWIVLMIIGGIIDYGINFHKFYQAFRWENYFIPLWVFIVFVIISFVNIIFAMTLLYYKKWGFFSICGTAIIAFGINTYLYNLGEMALLVVPMIGLVSPLILFAVLQIRKNGISCWKNLE